MEESRTNVTKDSIDLYFQLLSQMIDGTPASLVYNMDKAGQDDFVDLHSFHVIVIVDYQGNVIKVPVRRNSKRATLINCICSDGTYLKLLIIIPRKIIDSIIFKKLTLNNVLIKSQKNGFANTEIIKIWLEQKLQEEDIR